MNKLGQLLSNLLLIVYVLCVIGLLIFLIPQTGLEAKDVLTGSMRPAIPSGSLVIIHRVPLSALMVGDVVTYNTLGGQRTTITHRIISKETKSGVPYFTTKGDANKIPDAEIVGGQVIGKVVYHVPLLGKLTDWLKTPVGIAVALIIPSLFIITYEIKRLRLALHLNPKQPKHPTSRADAQPKPDEIAAPAATRAVARHGIDGLSHKLIAIVVLAALLAGASTTISALTSNTVAFGNNSLAASAH